ncbi:MAG: molybdopterin-dependent oxidoreductase [Methylobacterium mesophilicum]|nr:molybdopterin-dependent oxidoreductase [Methylobacterium mesophilicum]
MTEQGGSIDRGEPGPCSSSALIRHGRKPLNAETPLARLAQSRITPQPFFYIRTHGEIPRLEAARCRVTVGGMVETPLDLSLDTLRARFSEHSVEAVMQCAGNRRADMAETRRVEGDPWAPGAIGNAVWTGVRLGDVLRAAGVWADAALHVAFLAHDQAEIETGTASYGVSIPLEKALSDEVLLAYAMNGEALSAEHGYPLRVVVPGYAGARSAKWLASIRVQERESDNHFQQEEYRLFPSEARKETRNRFSPPAIEAMPLNAAICVPEQDARVPSGPLRLRGYAVATESGVGRVEVSVDGGASWQAAEITDASPDRWGWVLWQADVAVTAGHHRLAVRAFSRTGAAQPADMAEVWNFKGYLGNAWHRIRVTAA